jgi:MurNAc alpha-1-phosphate uridylyltransferase
MNSRTAMLLAAGRGERMGKLTQHTPKPLLKFKGKTLIERHLENLSSAGFTDVVINVSYLSSQIEDFVGNGSNWNLNVLFSNEDPVLETAGGIKKALPLIKSELFAVINADIFTEFNYANIYNVKISDHVNAHLYLIDNPAHNPNGDFYLNKFGFLELKKSEAKTFSGIAIYRKIFFDEISANTYLKLAPFLYKAIEKKLISGELLNSKWADIGTPERLNSLNEL